MTINTLQAEEHTKNAYYSNGKADLCSDLLEQFPNMPDEIRENLYELRSVERTQAIKQFENSIKLLKGEK